MKLNSKLLIDENIMLSLDFHKNVLGFFFFFGGGRRIIVQRGWHT